MLSVVLDKTVEYTCVIIALKDTKAQNLDRLTIHSPDKINIRHMTEPHINK
jgi:hypothetical protein